jgi:hypothetical protein
MAHRQHGNGDGGGTVVLDVLEPNWILIHDPKQPDLGRIPGLLVKVLRHWLDERPKLRVAGALGITSAGYTVAVNAWVVTMDEDPPAHQEPWNSRGVVIEELAPGWVVVRYETPGFLLESNPRTLVAALQTWARERPEIQVAATLGIEENGQTTSIHVWIDPTWTGG